MKKQTEHPIYVHPSLADLVRLQFDARGFSLLPRQPVHSLLSGRHSSRLRGRGLQFEELRDYRPGDDIRTIDWHATARLRKPHVRVYSEERERPVLLVVDQRISMFFGSDRTTKATAAAEAAALTAWRTLDAGDRIGAILFNDDNVVQIKPHRSRSNALRICHEMVEMNKALSVSGAQSNASVLNEAMRRAASIAAHDYLVVLVSDCHGYDEETRRLATTIAAHNDMISVLVYDPLGVRLPTSSRMDVTDGQDRVTIHPGHEFSHRYERLFVERLDELRETFRSLRVPILPICTHEPVINQVLEALGASMR